MLIPMLKNYTTKIYILLRSLPVPLSSELYRCVPHTVHLSTTVNRETDRHTTTLRMWPRSVGSIQRAPFSFSSSCTSFNSENRYINKQVLLLLSSYPAFCRSFVQTKRARCSSPKRTSDGQTFFCWIRRLFVIVNVLQRCRHTRTVVQTYLTIEKHSSFEITVTGDFNVISRAKGVCSPVLWRSDASNRGFLRLSLDQTSPDSPLSARYHLVSSKAVSSRPSGVFAPG